MEIAITLSANAGVALDMDGRRIWVDALHTGKQLGFSALTPKLQQKMLQNEGFFHPEYICYTHCHPDHYSAPLTEAAQKLWPNAQLLMPKDQTVEKEGLTIRFLPLPHEGSQYADVDHFGLLISYCGRNIFVSGDCAVAAPELAVTMNGVPIHVALMDFPWATLRKGREFLRRHFREANVVLFHLPFEEDDVNGYRTSAKNAAGQVEKCCVLCDPLQRVSISV